MDTQQTEPSTPNDPPAGRSPRPALPGPIVDRLFARFTAIYGAQKMAGAWANVDVGERNRAWGEGLAMFDATVIGDAVRDLAQVGTGWPPTIPEFFDLCERQMQRPGRNVRALPVPQRTEDQMVEGKMQLERIRSILKGAVRKPAPRVTSGPAREPGSDDEPVAPAPPPACTCWHGKTRTETLCPTCSTFVANRIAVGGLAQPR